MKFKITDKKGQQYMANSKKPIKKSFKDEDFIAEEMIAEDAKPSLTEEEIKLVKELLEKAPEILALVKPEDKKEKGKEEKGKKPGKGKESDEDEDILENFDKFDKKPDEEDFDEEDIDIDEEDEDESITSGDSLEDEDCYNCHDSKKSFGSIETKNVNDSVEEVDEIAQYWAKYYGGNK